MHPAYEAFSLSGNSAQKRAHLAKFVDANVA
jgi:hypothetical protein